MNNEINDMGILDQITEYALEIGIKAEDIDIRLHTDYGTPYIAYAKDRHNYKYKLLNNFIMELLLMHKLDEGVKKKFGKGGWKVLNDLFGFKQYYIKIKIKRYLKVLDTYLKEFDKEIDIIDRRKSPEEIKQEMVKFGYLKKD